MADDFSNAIEADLPMPSAGFPSGNDDSFSDDDFSVDFTGVEAMGAGFEAKPNGWYKCTITKIGKTETKNAGKLPAGTPGANVEFTVICGPNGPDEKYQGQKIWSNYWLHPNNIGFLKGLLRASGEFTEEELNGPLPGTWTKRVIDKVVMVKNSQRTYQGEQRDNVNGLKSVAEYEESKREGAADDMPSF
jgi:hypothetical protein